MSERVSYTDRTKEWGARAVLSASEVPLGGSKREIANELYKRIRAAVKEIVIVAANDTTAFGGYAAYTASVRLKLTTLRDDFISRRELARLILEQRDSVIGSREPSAEEAAVWAAAEVVAAEKQREVPQ